MDDLQINDEYIEDLLRYISRFLSIGAGDISVENRIREYIAILKKLRNQAVLSGAFADKLDLFISYAEKLDSVCSEVNSDLQSCGWRYLKEIDIADQFLY